MSLNRNEHQVKKETETDARIYVRKYLPSDTVLIIESRGAYYIEWGELGAMVRVWERLVYEGRGKDCPK